MAKVTIEGNIIEGTPEEIRETLMMLAEMAKEQEGERKTAGDEARDVYRLKEETVRDVVEGDFVKFHRPFADITKGKEYEVNNHCGQLVIIDDEGVERNHPLVYRERYKIRGVDYSTTKRAPGEFKKGDIVWHDDAWFNREGIGEVVGFHPSSGVPDVRGVTDDGRTISFFLRPERMKLVAAVENREDYEGTE